MEQIERKIENKKQKVHDYLVYKTHFDVPLDYDNLNMFNFKSKQWVGHDKNNCMKRWCEECDKNHIKPSTCKMCLDEIDDDYPTWKLTVDNNTLCVDDKCKDFMETLWKLFEAFYNYEDYLCEESTTEQVVKYFNRIKILFNNLKLIYAERISRDY